MQLFMKILKMMIQEQSDRVFESKMLFFIKIFFIIKTVFFQKIMSFFQGHVS